MKTFSYGKSFLFKSGKLIVCLICNTRILISKDIYQWTISKYKYFFFHEYNRNFFVKILSIINMEIHLIMRTS